MSESWIERLRSEFVTGSRFTSFGAVFHESSEINGDAPKGIPLSVSEYDGVIPRKAEEGQKPSEDVSKYRVVRPGQLAVNLMWLNRSGLGISEYLGYVLSPVYRAYTVNRGYVPRFAHYLLRFLPYRDAFSALGKGVRPNSQMVDAVDLRQLPIPVVDVEIQQRIADYLDRETAEMDAMETKLVRLLSLLEERRGSLLDRLNRGAPGVERVQLRQISLSVGRGFAPRYADTGLPVISQKCIRHSGRFNVARARFHDQCAEPVNDEDLVRTGDIVIASTGQGTLGRSALIPPEADRMGFDGHVSRVRVNSDLADPNTLHT